MVTIRTISAPIINKTENERMIMRLKEGKSFSSRESGEFHSRDKTNGLEISGISLKSTDGKGEVVAVVRQNKGSNNHILLITNSPLAEETSATAQQVPLTYADYFNLHNPPRYPSPEELYNSSIPALSHAISSLPQRIPQLAFAHVVPTPGHTVHASFALSEGMVAMLTNVSSRLTDEDPHMSIITSDMLTPSPTLSGISTGMVAFPRGTKFILATSMDAYTSTQPLETVSQVYNASRQILSAVQANSRYALQDLASFLHLPGLWDDVMNAVSSSFYSPEYHALLKRNDDMGLAAMITRDLLSRSVKEKRYGNYVLPERVAVIGSRVPSLRRRKTHET